MNLNFNSNIYNKGIYNPVFTSSSRDVYNDKGELIHRNDTSLFRSDIGDWDKFAQYINNKFKNCDKVNIYSLSCSSGDEVYSLVMKLIDKYGEKGAEKYFPIHASDYDEKIINMAKEGYLPLFEDDIELINNQTNGKFNDYFEILQEPPQIINDMKMEQYSDYDIIAKVKDKLRNKVEFKVADATKECKLVKPENSLVMVRNFFPYLKDEISRINLAENLYKTLDKTSVVVIGKFDDTSNAFASMNLTDAGFICNPENYCIWEKNTVEDIGKYILGYGKKIL